MKYSRLCLVGMCLLFLGGGIVAQDQYLYNTDVERAFAVALQLFQQNKFSESASEFDRLLTLKPTHQRTTAAYIMSSKAHFQLKEYSASEARARELLRDFPSTTYRQDAIYLEGLNAMMQQNYEGAARSFLNASLAIGDSMVAERSLSFFEGVSTERLSIESLSRMFRDSPGREARDVLALKLAERYAAVDDASHAKDLLAMVSPGDHPAAFNRRLRGLENKLSLKTTAKIALILPASAESDADLAKTLADDVLDGASYAVDEYNASARTGARVALEVRKINGDPASIRAVQQIASSSENIAIVGPLFSNLAIAYAPIADAERIPMISPTANADGLASRSRYVFQTNPDVTTRAKAIARYAVGELGLKRFAVLASRAPQSKSLADSFSEEVRRLGAEVAAYELYNKDSSDLREQFMRIREAGVSAEPSISFAGKITREQVRSMMRAGADAEFLDEARQKREIVPVTKLFGPRGKEIADSLHLPLIVSTGGARNIEIPVTGLDGILVSISGSEEIGVIASQMSYFNVKGQLLGSGEWYDLAQLESNKRYLDGIEFISDSYVREGDSLYDSFEQSFLRTKGKQPTRNTLYGYDTMKLILTQLGSGVATREGLARLLEQVKAYRGLHTKISLNGGRVNSVVHILTYHNSSVTIAAEVDVK